LKSRPGPLERAFPYIVFSGVLVAWEMVCRLGFINSVLLPPPSAIIATTILGMIDPRKAGYDILTNLLHSLVVMALGYVTGVLCGVATSIALGRSSVLYRLWNPILGFFLSIPAIALIPVFMVWLGPGVPTIFAIVTIACFSPVVYNTTTGIRAVPKHFVWQAQSFGARPGFVFARILLPSAFPSMLMGIKLGLAASWRALIGAEMFGGVSLGLGFMLINAEQFYATDVMFSALMLVAIMGLLIEQGFLRSVERRTVERWGMAQGWQG
jgi:sulfonate transport system permease protein